MTDIAILAQAISNGIIDGQKANLRDQFAMAALPECMRIVSKTDSIYDLDLDKMAAMGAYDIADAMLKARENDDAD